MSRSGLLFAAFCLGVVALYFSAARDGYSPFASGGGRGVIFGGRTGGGPQHK